VAGTHLVDSDAMYPKRVATVSLDCDVCYVAGTLIHPGLCIDLRVDVLP
jgi:hypothetical protein